MAESKKKLDEQRDSDPTVGDLSAISGLDDVGAEPDIGDLETLGDEDLIGDLSVLDDAIAEMDTALQEHSIHEPDEADHDPLEEIAGDDLPVLVDSVDVSGLETRSHLSQSTTPISEDNDDATVPVLSEVAAVSQLVTEAAEEAAEAGNDELLSELSMIAQDLGAPTQVENTADEDAAVSDELDIADEALAEMAADEIAASTQSEEEMAAAESGELEISAEEEAMLAASMTTDSAETAEEVPAISEELEETLAEIQDAVGDEAFPSDEKIDEEMLAQDNTEMSLLNDDEYQELMGYLDEEQTEEGVEEVAAEAEAAVEEMQSESTEEEPEEAIAEAAESATEILPEEPVSEIVEASEAISEMIPAEPASESVAGSIASSAVQSFTDELHTHLAKKIDELLLEAINSISEELNNNLAERVENLLLNSVDTAMPTLMQQLSEGLRAEVQQQVKQELPGIVNDMLGNLSYKK